MLDNADIQFISYRYIFYIRILSPQNINPIFTGISNSIASNRQLRIPAKVIGKAPIIPGSISLIAVPTPMNTPPFN